MRTWIDLWCSKAQIGREIEKAANPIVNTGRRWDDMAWLCSDDESLDDYCMEAMYAADSDYEFEGWTHKYY